jgi:cytochrome c-type biogenesis protein CcmF
MTLAHAGLGLFVIGASVETAWRLEAGQVLGAGDRLEIGAYTLRLNRISPVEGPNFTAERIGINVARRSDGASVCEAGPERRFYPANRQTTSKIALCFEGLSDLYIVAGDARPTADGRPGRLIRAYWNPWARLIFLGPLLMALGGAVSLRDRRLRLAAPRRAPAAAEARA